MDTCNQPKQDASPENPSDGVFYFIPKKEGTWEIEALRFSEDKLLENQMHLALWRNSVWDKLFEEWDVSLNRKDRFRNLYRGIPRGRVFKNSSINSWYVRVGMEVIDYVPHWTTQVCECFGLVGANQAGAVYSMHWDHEDCVAPDVKALEDVGIVWNRQSPFDE